MNTSSFHYLFQSFIEAAGRMTEHYNITLMEAMNYTEQARKVLADAKELFEVIKLILVCRLIPAYIQSLEYRNSQTGLLQPQRTA